MLNTAVCVPYHQTSDLFSSKIIQNNALKHPLLSGSSEQSDVQRREASNGETELVLVKLL